jgi:hypothetical protein
MYSEKLEKLINIALADGVLTEKEKQILFKNAAIEGWIRDIVSCLVDEITKILIMRCTMNLLLFGKRNVNR